MRTMVTASIPVEGGNAAVKDGRLAQVMGAMMDRHHPEAAYFFAEHGRRTAMFVIDLKDPSQIPSIAEPFFRELNASVTFLPVMNADDLKKGLSKIS